MRVLSSLPPVVNPELLADCIAAYKKAEMRQTSMGDISPPQSSCLRLPSPLSEMEAKFYYSGLPSGPVLVARTGAPWEAPTDPEAPRKLKTLRPVYNHAFTDVWGASLAPKVVALLDSMKVKFTSIDIVRIGYPEDSFFPVIIWIGVTPKSLSGDDGFVVASKCRELLVEYDITDVDVEIRESVTWPRFD